MNKKVSKAEELNGFFKMFSALIDFISLIITSIKSLIGKADESAEA